MVDSEDARPGPLAGLRVLDISSFIAAPAAAVVLGDWGADVIKIEGPDGDPNRRIMHDSSNYPKSPVNYPWEMDSRNKRSIVLDLKQEAARAALDRLIAQADVLICNFPPLVREKLKLAYDDVKSVNPRLIYASLTGYGEQGPDRDRPGFDATAYFARSGLLDAQRYEGGPPGVPGPAQGDRATAMTLVSAILMALMHRQKTGEGSWVGTSLLGNGLWSCGVIAQAALVGAFLGARPPPERPRSALGNIYRTSDDRWLQLTIVRTDKLWAPLCQALERPELIDDPRFSLNAKRVENYAATVKIVQDWLDSTKDDEDALALMDEHRVPAAPVLSVEQAVNHPHLRGRRTVRTIKDRIMPDFDIPGVPLKFSQFPEELPLQAPLLGEHNGEILTSYLGYSAERIKQLEGDGVLYQQNI